MGRLYLLLAVLMSGLGVVHVSATFAFFDTLSSRAIWFASGGLAMILTGVINLLNRAYGAAAPGVRWAPFGANFAMTVFAALAGIAGAASAAQQIVVVLLMVMATLLSWWLPVSA